MLAKDVMTIIETHKWAKLYSYIGVDIFVKDILNYCQECLS